MISREEIERLIDDLETKQEKEEQEKVPSMPTRNYYFKGRQDGIEYAIERLKELF